MNKKGQEGLTAVICVVILIVIIWAFIFISIKNHNYIQGIDCKNMENSGHNIKMVEYSQYGIKAKDCYIETEDGEYTWIKYYRGGLNE